MDNFQSMVVYALAFWMIPVWGDLWWGLDIIVMRFSAKEQDTGSDNKREKRLPPVVCQSSDHKGCESAATR
ncbi:hypothetical protein [Xenorhabdus griffiniae]|uniref:Conjugal transfer protein TraG n=1 Tax=Xenorhabdus griffiniae TaxID=351672 RepID=A0ABY9XDB5_9GAMM|nr:hypothetical protein [Xenorhabdus griffiniae]MBD1229541.1 hypothetical protein [Xenorhabdus griffiniae]MBE8589342.1 hypothetical protein [Xenorhabdus griffiniae]WMV70890.1 hypothetical protein QL128_11745 [Xenorhabdus griffiniae]WNH00566.1 hypothetical protein QL112_011750 [Xenorhabdus griffiniae]